MAEGSCGCGRSFPRGYRFRPTDEDYLFYLKLKIDKKPIPIREFSEVNLSEYHPQTISERCPRLGDNGWHVFTSRNRKYKNGLRPNRAAGTGYWKATGKDIAIKGTNGTEQVILGYKQALVFCQGKPSKGIPTHWGMHEYRIDKPQPSRRGSADMMLDDLVLCRIYENQRRRNGNITNGGTAHDQSQQDSVENIELINVGDGAQQDSVENIELINLGDGAQQDSVENIELINVGDGAVVEYQDYEEGDPVLFDNSTHEEVLGFEDYNLIMERNDYNWVNDWAIIDNNTMSRCNRDLETQSQNIVATSINQVSQLPVLPAATPNHVDQVQQFSWSPNVVATPTYINPVHQFSGSQNVVSGPSYVNQVSQLPVLTTQFQNVVATPNNVDFEGSIPTQTVNQERDREDKRPRFEGYFAGSSWEQIQQAPISSESDPTTNVDDYSQTMNFCSYCCCPKCFF